MDEKLIHLVEKWEKIARNKFISAEKQNNNTLERPTGKQFIEHGAVCYCNCASELRVALSFLSPSLLTTPQEDQK